MRFNQSLRAKAIAALFLFVLVCSSTIDGQTKRRTGTKTRTAAKPAVELVLPPAVTLVDEVTLRKLLVPDRKPLLVNFWATWCDPCREEFPDLVKLDTDYRDKIRFITVSLDDPADISKAVPEFLSSMKANMPAFLLKAADEGAVISSISKEWQGGMPFTILYGADGNIAYFRQGKIQSLTLRGEIDKLLHVPARATSKAP